MTRRHVTKQSIMEYILNHEANLIFLRLSIQENLCCHLFLETRQRERILPPNNRLHSHQPINDCRYALCNGQLDKVYKSVADSVSVYA